MGITKEQLIKLHPQFFHMAEEGTWPSIQENGLLSTSALLDFCGVNGDERDQIEIRNRRTSSSINHPDRGAFVIRDQIPMTDTALEKCLTGMTIKEWYQLLNSRVFLWATWDRLKTLLNARAYKDKTQCIITVDSASFLDKYADQVELSPINSGSTIYRPQPRGRDTFLPLADFPFDEWRRKRSRSEVIAEITVNHSVPDIADFVTEVVHVRGEIILERIV